MTQPYLHRLMAAVRAPGLALADEDNSIRGHGVNGVFVADRRVMSTCEVALDGAELVPVLSESVGASATLSVLVARGLGDESDDPTVTVEHLRRVEQDHALEVIELRSSARRPVHTALRLGLAGDLADIADVKAGRTQQSLPAEVVEGGLRWQAADGAVVRAVAVPAPDRTVAGAPSELSWDVELHTGETVRFELRTTVSGDPTPLVVLGPHGGSHISVPQVESDDRRFVALVAQSVADLAALELSDAEEPVDHFLAAGVPWYLTLFGRDSLIAARMSLPLGTALAAGTLRALGRRQGTRVDIDAAEQPGKIPHEIRRTQTDHGEGSRSGHTLILPPTYYGTVDATALWVMLLHDAWRWGLPDNEVADLLPTMERGLAWMRDYGLDPNGFVSYTDESGHGLANQGWKDSGDAIQFRDGRLAEAPVSLSEVQGYAYAAAMNGAALMQAFGSEGADEWQAWAAALGGRFRDRFWLSDEFGDYPAVALDGGGNAVDSVASNMGHLLGTGLLNRSESEIVAARLGRPDMSSGFGLRTLSALSVGYNPLSYHCGSVWTHDTAMAITGLGAAAREGIPHAAETATALIIGLLDAAATFDYRMPELHSGDPARDGSKATAYPASCRPQAWAAAAAIACLSTIAGLAPDVPSSRMVVAPLRPSPIGALRVRGLRVAGNPFDIDVAPDGTLAANRAVSGLRIEQR
jgi:glycogen debranching enzyme